MDQISDALKSHQSYEVLQKLYTAWDADFKALLFVDLAVMHRCAKGLKLISDIEGPQVFESPYDEHEKVTPIYVAQLLGQFNSEYLLLANYMESRVKGSRKWERVHGWIWVLEKTQDKPLGRLSDDLRRMVAEELL